MMFTVFQLIYLLNLFFVLIKFINKYTILSYYTRFKYVYNADLFYLQPFETYRLRKELLFKISFLTSILMSIEVSGITCALTDIVFNFFTFMSYVTVFPLYSSIILVKPNLSMRK